MFTEVDGVHANLLGEHCLIDEGAVALSFGAALTCVRIGQQVAERQQAKLEGLRLHALSLTEESDSLHSPAGPLCCASGQERPEASFARRPPHWPYDQNQHENIKDGVY